MKVIIVCFILMFYTSLNVSGQGGIEFRVKNLDPDSLALQIKEKEGIEKIDALNKLSNVLCRKNIDSSINCAEQAIQLAEQLKYRKGLADGYFYLGNDYYLLDSIRPLITNYLKAFRIYEDLEPCDEYINLCAQLAVVNMIKGRWESTLNYFRQTLSLSNTLRDSIRISEATVSIALSFNYLDEIDSAFYYNYKSLEILDQRPYYYLYGVVYNELGRLNGQRFNATNDTAYLTEAISWFAKAVDLVDQKKLKNYLQAIGNIAFYYKRYNLPDSIAKGEKYFQKLFAIEDTSRWMYGQIGKGYYNAGKQDSAIFMYKKALSKAETELANFTMNSDKNPFLLLRIKGSIKRSIQGNNRALYKIYSELGEYEKALKHLEVYQQMVEHLRDKETNDLIDLLEIQSKDEKKKSKIIIMGQANEMKDAKISQARMANYGLITIVIVIGLVGVMFVRQNKMKNEHKTVLLEQKLLRLQMNPHFIFNALSNILNFVERNENKIASNYLATFSKLLRTTLESTREDTVPFEKEVNSLKNYLELQKLRYKEKFDYHVEVDKQIDEEDMSIPPMLVQPFIENAIEHGIRHKKTPGRIDVRFFLKDKKILCEVEDDGVGREKAWETEVEERSGHKSLATEIIRDRIKSLNKKLKQKIQLEIIDKISENKEATGTKVLLDLPYSSAYE